MQTVADAAGVSKMTVFRVLHNSPMVRQEVRDRVMQAVAKLNYRPSPVVTALMKQIRQGKGADLNVSIALFGDRPIASVRVDPYLSRVLAGSQKRADSLGYGVSYFDTNEPNMTGKRLAQILTTRAIQGVIVGYGVEHDRLGFPWGEFSAVSWGYRPNFHVVANNHARILQLALNELGSRGFKRIGLALHEHEDERLHWIWRSLYLNHNMMAAPADRVPLCESRQFNRDTFLTWYFQCSPEVVLSHWVEPLLWLRESGVEVPGQTNFVCLDLARDDGEIAGVWQNYEEEAACAVDLIDTQIQVNERGFPLRPRMILVDGQWLDGKSLGKAQRKSKRARRSKV